MAERALMRAWTIVGVASSGRRSSDAGCCGGGGASAVAGVAEAAAAEAGGASPCEMLCQLPDSFHTFHYLLEQIRMKQSFLQEQQEQQLVALLQIVAMVGVNAAATTANAPVSSGGVGLESGTATAGSGGSSGGGGSDGGGSSDNMTVPAAAVAALGGLVMGGPPMPLTSPDA